MEIVAMEVSMVLLLAAIILLLRRQRALTAQSGSAPLSAVDDVTLQAELMQPDCLSALARLGDDVALLERRTISLEQQLASLTAAPRPERQEHYQAAALLLAAGHDGGRVASLLDLPLVHVEMIRDLKNILLNDTKAARGNEPKPAVKSARRKVVGASVKTKLRPILLTEAVEPAHAVNG